MSGHSTYSITFMKTFCKTEYLTKIEGKYWLLYTIDIGLKEFYNMFAKLLYKTFCIII